MPGDASCTARTVSLSHSHRVFFPFAVTASRRALGRGRSGRSDTGAAAARLPSPFLMGYTAAGVTRTQVSLMSLCLYNFLKMHQFIKNYIFSPVSFNLKGFKKSFVASRL